MANVGYATLQVIPSVRGIGDELRRQLVGPAADAGTDAGEDAGGGFADSFKGALAAIGVAALAEKAGEVFSEAFSQALEQSNITSTLQAQLGASNADASKYGAIVGKLYAKGVTENFEQGAEAVRSIVSGGLVDPTATNAQLESIATKMTDVANVFGTDMGLQTQAVSALLKNHIAPDAADALDVITYGLQKLGPNAEDILETFQEYPVQLRKLGLDADTALGLFQQGLQGGARDTDIIADALKEFSIRAIDGSTTTAAGYKLLGLNVKETSALVAKGGESASSALDIVLDRLRGIPDPVKRAAAATDLFGSQSEDLGAALFKLDPSSALDKLGNFTGAADQLGKTLRSGPSYEIEVFKRTVQQGLVTFIGGKVLPILSKWGAVFDEDVLPPLAAVGGALDSAFLPTLSELITVGKGTVNWVREWGIWLAPLAILIGGITLALSAEAIATGAVNLVFGIYRGVILAGTAVTEGFAAAQAVLNAVMEINPIVLIVIAVLALAAAVYIAWKRSDTFRSVVMAAWHGIQTAAMAAWTTVLKPMIAGLVTGWQAVAAGALWLWRTVLAPTFSFLSIAARIIATIIGVVLVIAFKIWWTGVQLYAALVMLAFRGIAAVAMWLWQAVLSPVVGWIVAGFKLLWAGVVLYVGFVIAIFRLAGSVAMWLWRSAISPVVGWVVAGFKLLWAGVVLYVGFVIAILHLLGDAGLWLYRTAISPSLHGIATLAQWLYDKGIKPPINAAIQLAHEFGAAFTSAKDVIGREFGKVADLAKKPIGFVIDTVYNKGLLGVWNSVASAFGAPKLKPFPGFATGGPVFGAGTETSDDVPAWLSKNEHVWTAREVRGAGGHGAVAALRAWAAAGGGPLTPGFKGGGAFGWIGKAANAVSGVGSKAWDLAKGGASWLKDTLAASARAGVNAVVNPLLSQIPGLDTGWGKLIKRVPSHMIDALFGFADSADKKGASSSTGGGSLGQWIAKAIGLANVPGSWAGPLRTLVMRESGGNPRAINLTDINAQHGDPSRGLAQTIGATFEHYRLRSLVDDIYDPIANLVAAIRYIQARYGTIFRVQQADASKPPAGYAGGTRSALPGWSWVGENGPELMNLRGGESIASARASLAAQAAASEAAAAAASSSGVAYAGSSSVAGRSLTVPVYYSAPTPEDPEKAAMEFGRRISKAVSV